MAAINLPNENPVLHRTLNQGQWQSGLDAFQMLGRTVTVWEDAEYLFQILNHNGEPYCRCFWKLGNREIYCDPADCHILRPFRPT